MTRRLVGVAVAPGVSWGPAARVDPPPALGGHPAPSGGTGSVGTGSVGSGSVGTGSVAQPPPAEERRRLLTALDRAGEQCRALAASFDDSMADEADIFDAHAEFVDDPELRADAIAAVDAGAPAVAAVQQAFGRFRELLAASSSPYLAARATDLDDVAHRVIRLLNGSPGSVSLPDGVSVVVAHELTPSQTAEFPRERVAALVTEAGSPTSHAAILARSLGIPAVVGVGGLLEAAGEANVVAVDGSTGEVFLDPDEPTWADLRTRQQQWQSRRAELAATRGVPGATADGVRVELAANVASVDEAAVAAEFGAEAAGLVRTELLFQDAAVAPSVDVQQEYYGAILAALGGRRVVFRTLDVGADKPVPFIRRTDEPNPALGVRGIRMATTHPELFETQLRALVRAHRDRGPQDGRVAIMVPMVAVESEVVAARAQLRQVATVEGVDPADIEFGAMVEVPAAALAARQLARHVSFLSIGTNDLVQYLFAADRLVAELHDTADVWSPVVIDLIARVAEAAAATGAWVGVCGESASDPAFAGVLVGAGVRELSMSASGLDAVRHELARHSLAELQQLAGACRAAESGAEARRLAGR